MEQTQESGIIYSIKMDDNIVLLGAGIMGAEVMGITNFTGEESGNSGANNSGFSGFANQIGNQISGIQDSIFQTQENLQTISQTAVTANELASALSGIDTGPTMADVNSAINSNMAGIETLFDKYATNNSNPEDSSDSRNQDNGETTTNTSGGLSPEEWVDLRVQELDIRERENEIAQQEAENRDLRNSPNQTVADAAEIGVEAGNFVNGISNWVATNPITQKSNEGFNDVSQLLGSGTIEKSEGESTSLIGDVLSPGPKYHGPDPLNLGGNKDTEDSENTNWTRQSTPNRTTETGNEKQNENEERKIDTSGLDSAGNFRVRF